MSTTVIVQEQRQDLQILSQNGYNLQLVRTVRNNGQQVSNVVFAARSVSPYTELSWNNQYALSWTQSQPTPGILVQLSGNWQPCSMGQSYSLDQSGSWQPNGGGGNGVSASSNFSNPVYVVIGAQGESGQWQPIFVSPNPLFPGDNANYEPTQQIQLFYDQNISSGTVVSGNPQNATTFDMGGQSQQYFEYSAMTGQWNNQSNPFQG